MFALRGPGLLSTSIEDMLNWLIPFAENGSQGFCKAYARLALSLSQTIPAFCFAPEQVSFVKDKTANGLSEFSAFDDPNVEFVYPYDVDDPTVMNDGSSLISVGAAKEVCKELGITGTRPVSF